MNTNSTPTVVIVGAGPSGLMAAIILAMNGVPFRIVDKKSGPVEETRALVVHAKTLELWNKLGLAHQALADGRRMGAVQMLRNGQPIGMLTFMDTGADQRTPFPFALSYTQDQSEHMLVERLRALGCQVEWNTSVVGLEQTASDVRVHVQHMNGSDETITARWVVGADGARSPVRHALNLALRGDTYAQSLFLADVELDWAFDPERLVLDITERGFMAYFPTPGTKRYRLVGAIMPEYMDKETLSLADIQRQIDQTSTIKVTLRDPRWISIYRIHHRMSERFRIGRVFLVGDAAHIHSPAGGQGMNTGIGDAFNLAWKLSLVANDMAYETILDSYEPERMPFARAILNGSDRGFSAFVTNKLIGRLIKLYVLPWLFRVVLSLLPLRRQAFWFVSQLWTAYRNSPLVATSNPTKRGPRPGDRAPTGILEEGTSKGTALFDLLTGVEHHLLMFEGTQPASGASPTDEALTTLVAGYAAPITLHSIGAANRQLHRRYGVTNARLFLVRPDGHIAYSGKGSDLRGLKRYLDSHFIPRLLQAVASDIETEVATMQTIP